MRQVSATVDDVTMMLTDLQPRQRYHVWVMSVSASSKSERVLVTVTTRQGGLSAGLVTAFVTAAAPVFLALLTIAAAISFLIRYTLY